MSFGWPEGLEASTVCQTSSHVVVGFGIRRRDVYATIYVGKRCFGYNNNGLRLTSVGRSKTEMHEKAFESLYIFATGSQYCCLRHLSGRRLHYKF